MSARFRVRKFGNAWYALDKTSGAFTAHPTWRRAYANARFKSQIAGTFAALAEIGRKQDEVTAKTLAQLGKAMRKVHR